MTTLRGVTLEQKFRRHPGQYKFYVPSGATSPHPLSEADAGYQPVLLENGRPYGKPGYVIIRDVYCMDWHDARRAWGSQGPSQPQTYNLGGDSIGRLLKLVHRRTRYVCDRQHNMQTELGLMRQSHEAPRHCPSPCIWSPVEPVISEIPSKPRNEPVRQPDEYRPLLSEDRYFVHNRYRAMRTTVIGPKWLWATIWALTWLLLVLALCFGFRQMINEIVGGN